MNQMQRIEKRLLKPSAPAFQVGDTVRVHVKVIEGEKERIQVFEGVVIGKRGGSNRQTFAVRKVSYGVGVERVFPLHSPFVEKVDVVRSGRVRRAKLYYQRSRKGRSARIAERGMDARLPRKTSELATETAEVVPVETLPVS
jgi:large subunit ribosomal protein L19